MYTPDADRLWADVLCRLETGELSRAEICERAQICERTLRYRLARARELRADEPAELGDVTAIAVELTEQHRSRSPDGEWYDLWDDVISLEVDRTVVINDGRGRPSRRHSGAGCLGEVDVEPETTDHPRTLAGSEGKVIWDTTEGGRQ
jgi:hypothetical protein